MDNQKYGLCCISLALNEIGIKYKKITFKTFSSLQENSATKKLENIYLNNINTLKEHIIYCSKNNITRYRIPSDIFPLATHPALESFFATSKIFTLIIPLLSKVGKLSKELTIGLSFHPSQFVSIASSKESVRKASVKEINFNSQILDWLEAPNNLNAPINIHLNRQCKLFSEIVEDFENSLSLLSQNALSRLTIENEDRGFWNVENLLKFLAPYKIPLLLDLHHNQLNPSKISQKKAMELSARTWKPFEPIFHISSGDSKNPRKHAEFCKSPPTSYKNKCVFMVEAKAKDYAIKNLILHKRKR